MTHTVKPLLIRRSIGVATYDIDFAGHVSNQVYLRWLEDMRLQLFEEHFPLEDFLAEGITPVIASTFIEYKSPIKLFDKPYGEMWISKCGNASLTIEAEIFIEEKLASRAEHVGVFVDLKSMRPVRLPKRILDKFRVLVITPS
jgi:acyl-CoA thioester hydrolase